MKLTIQYIKEAEEAIQIAMNRIDYSSYNAAVKKVNKLEPSDEKVDFEKKLNEIYIDLENKYSSKLKSLKVSGNVINLEKNKFEYEIMVDKDVTNALIEVSSLSANAIIKGGGSVVLEPGSNDFRINVTNGIYQDIYLIKIFRAKDTKVTQIRVNGVLLDLNNPVITVAPETSKINLQVNTADGNADVRGVGEIGISNGDNRIVFQVNGVSHPVIVKIGSASLSERS